MRAYINPTNSKNLFVRPLISILDSLKENCQTVSKKKIIFIIYKNFNENYLNHDLSNTPFHITHILDDVHDIY